ncbi:MAG: GntR family transcriptional regulator [Marinilabiliaceae bacterium]|nr:GntR family transcriptional regulator [Marinilabiliaceae bacterium]
MVQIGKFNTLKINRMVDFGAYLDGENLGEILIPGKYLEKNAAPGHEVTVFVSLDSEDRLIATTETPLAEVNQFALLRVKAVNSIGAFLDWGLTKDLLVPFREQKADMIEGRSYLVYVFLDDESKRIVASAKIEKFLNNTIPSYSNSQEVDLIIADETEIGYTAIINNEHTGILYHNEIFESLDKGQKIRGYIKKIRSDEKIDLTLYKPGYEKISSMAETVLSYLKMNNGFIPFNDKSDAEAIYDTFGMSKKNFKKSIGSLYKNRLVAIEDDGIRLL